MAIYLDHAGSRLYNNLHFANLRALEMIVIGLTGGIGSGKSEVSRILRKLGAELIDADRVGHQAYQPHTETWKALVAAFGEEIIQPSGEVDRKKLGDIVFSAPDALGRLNAMVHPRMYEMMKERLAELRSQGTRVAVIEAAVLIEAEWTPLVDEVWVTDIPEETAVKRVGGRDKLPEGEIRRRIRSQMSREERARYATVVIDNSAGTEKLRQRVQELWDSRVQGRVS